MKRTPLKRKGRRLNKRKATPFDHHDWWKAKGLTKCIDLVATDFQYMIRIESIDAAGNCVCCTCGRVAPYDEMHGGHFISRKNKRVIFQEATETIAGNCHAQCPQCNNPRTGDSGTAYLAFMVRTYGQARVDALIELSKQRGHDHTKPDLHDRRLEYIRRINAVFGVADQYQGAQR